MLLHVLDFYLGYLVKDTVKHHYNEMPETGNFASLHTEFVFIH